MPAFLLAVIFLPASSPEAPCATAADSAGALGPGVPEGEGLREVAGRRMSQPRAFVALAHLCAAPGKEAGNPEGWRQGPRPSREALAGVSERAIKFSMRAAHGPCVVNGVQRMSEAAVRPAFAGVRRLAQHRRTVVYAASGAVSTASDVSMHPPSGNALHI